MSEAALPVSVLIPTVGRVPQLRACLKSVAECAREPGELVVVDQSHGDEIVHLVEELELPYARVVRCDGSGVGTATNTGLSAAKYDTVLVTHDDCTVAPDWPAAGSDLAARHPGALLTGRVLPAGPPEHVPSTIEAADSHDYSGSIEVSVIYANNMVLRRSRTLEMGGFDDRVLHAEDNDFCYRWLRAGLPLRYEPGLVVWHHDWRAPEELEALYVRYARGQGLFYAKHMRNRDPRVLPFLWRDLRHAALARRSDYRGAIGRGLIPGMRDGWRIFERRDGTG